jgi:hypothetical protein
LNYSTAVFLINKNVRAIAGVYEPEENGRKMPRTIFKTLDDTIKVGDYVLVPTETRHKMTVNKVVEVDMEIDFESHAKMDWVISVVDRGEFERVVKMEENAIAQIKSAEKRKKQEELREALLKNNEFLKALPIADMTVAANSEGNL